MFITQKMSNYGLSTPAVARTFFQGSKLLKFFSVADEQRDETLDVLQELQRHLLRCVETRDRITKEVDDGRAEITNAGLAFQANGRAVQLPSVADLQSHAEAFLQAAKLAIAETAHIVEPFYGERHDHRYHKFAAWADNKFGTSDPFAIVLRAWEPWVNRILTMRNRVDHPSSRTGGRLVTRNFSLDSSQQNPELIDPMWGLSGEAPALIIPDMDSVIDGTIGLGEEIMCALFDKHKGSLPLSVFEIPVEERDPACPVRLRVALTPGSAEANAWNEQFRAESIDP